jgi:hypothetical protein
MQTEQPRFSAFYNHARKLDSLQLFAYRWGGEQPERTIYSAALRDEGRSHLPSWAERARPYHQWWLYQN